MRTLRHAQRSHRYDVRRRGLFGRATAMIEFAFILPIFMFMLMFSLDMGHMVLMSGAVQDATFSAARTGAQVGGASYESESLNPVCPVRGECRGGSTYDSLQDAIGQIPGTSSVIASDDIHMTIEKGGICRNDGGDDHVQITTHYSVKFITPGLSNMLKMVSRGEESAPDGAWAMSATAVARCEVIRSAP